jgi:hypothetical protein
MDVRYENRITLSRPYAKRRTVLVAKISTRSLFPILLHAVVPGFAGLVFVLSNLDLLFRILTLWCPVLQNRFAFGFPFCFGVPSEFSFL